MSSRAADIGETIGLNIFEPCTAHWTTHIELVAVVDEVLVATALTTRHACFALGGEVTLAYFRSPLMTVAAAFPLNQPHDLLADSP
ncbi:MAG: hypothetical protein ABIQ64_00720 [Candidatus Saccharimonadales bacterium]